MRMNYQHTSKNKWQKKQREMHYQYKSKIKQIKYTRNNKKEKYVINYLIE